MILFMDTTDRDRVTVALKNNSEVIKQLSEQNSYGSQVLFMLIEKILKETNTSKQDITGIEVATGPGSYTGVRVGVAVANALGFALHIPVNGKETETDLIYE
jgi:tRNA threonylcarbamoyladenosine biosynthesis protein TsaB